MSTLQKEEFIEAMQKDLDAYKADSSNAKQFLTSMKELSSWLAKREAK